MENKKKIIMMSALLLVLVAVVVGITYAVYTFTGNSTLNTIDLGRISMSYTEPSNAYVLDNALPMTDEEGKGQNNYFEFTVTSHATTKESDSVGITIPYEINISDIAIDEGMLELSKSLMKVNLTKVDGMTENEVVVPTLMSNLSSSSLNTGASVVYQANDTHKNGSTTITSKYRLRAWITEGFDVSDTDNTYQYKFRVNVNSNMDSLKPNATGETKLLRTAIMNQGVVDSGDGLYVSTETNDGRPTYYYHGNVENNYVKLKGVAREGCGYDGSEVYFADVSNATFHKITTEAECSTTKVCDARNVVYNGQTMGIYVVGVDENTCSYLGGTYTNDDATWADDAIDISWRVIRINEDQTVRLIHADLPGVSGVFNSTGNEYKYMYYSESNIEGGIKKALNDWYSANLTDYDNKIATSTFCEQAKVNHVSTNGTSGNAEMISYTEYEPDFKCAKDGNEYGLITDQKVGLITIDEVLHAGGGFNGLDETPQYYLSNTMSWTMSPAGFDNVAANAWYYVQNTVDKTRVLLRFVSHDTYNGGLPVINLNADVLVTGNGTSASPWVVQK